MDDLDSKMYPKEARQVLDNLIKLKDFIVKIKPNKIRAGNMVLISKPDEIIVFKKGLRRVLPKFHRLYKQFLYFFK